MDIIALLGFKQRKESSLTNILRLVGDFLFYDVLAAEKVKNL